MQDPGLGAKNVALFPFHTFRICPYTLKKKKKVCGLSLLSISQNNLKKTTKLDTYGISIIVVQLLSRVQLFATLWTAAHQSSLFFIISQCLLKLMSIELVIPSNYLVLCRPLLLPSIFSSIKVFSNELVLTSGGQSIGASASVLLMNIQDWFPLGLTDLIS